MKPGDIYATKLPDGRYGAVRVVQIVGKEALVCTSGYLDHELPSIDAPLLLEVLRQNRFRYNNSLAKVWLTGKPPESFQLIGNIPPAESEQKMKCKLFGGKWAEFACDEAYMEWRWVNDREAFEEKIRKQDEALKEYMRREKKPGKMISEGAFWGIIKQLDWAHEGNDDAVLAPAVQALAAMSKSDICEFEERLTYLLYQLDTKAHAQNIGEYSHKEDAGFSADGFLYARCAAVANGRGFYATALKNPEKMPKDLEFEALLGLARTAYESKTGEDFEHVPGCCCETFSNPAGWK